MSILTLPSPTAHLISASYSVQSFETAVQYVLQQSIHSRSTKIEITVHPQSLRFTLRDNRPHVPKKYFEAFVRSKSHNVMNHAAPSARIHPITALATTSAVEIRARTSTFAAVNVVRTSDILETRSVTSSEAHTILPHPGVQIEVWETFIALPVRRQIELSRPIQSLTQAVRHAVLAVALANPHVSITLHASNNVLLLQTIAEPSLSLSRIRALFEDAHFLKWVPVTMEPHSPLRISGFISTNALSHTRLQFVSVNHIPSDHNVIHSEIRKVWRYWFARGANMEANARRFPAYVLNCHHVHLSHSRSEKSFSLNGQLHLLIARAVACSLKRDNRSKFVTSSDVDTFSLVDDVKVKSKQQVSKTIFPNKILKTGKKRKRFADAVIPLYKRVPSHQSAWFAEKNSPATTNLAPMVHNFVLRSTPSSQMTPSKSPESNFRQISFDQDRVERPSDNADGLQLQHPSTGILSGIENDSSLGRVVQHRSVIINRESLSALRVVGQVERKFIVVIGNDDILYAVDQHAASERFLYEQLLRQTNAKTIKSWTLPRVKKITVSTEQRATVEEQRGVLAEWGWTLGLAEGENIIEMIQVPQLCKVFGNKNITLGDPEQLRNFLDNLLDGAVGKSTPRPFMDAIASAACHAAVRFGDVLSRRQCEALVQSLGQCDNPFLCAHGRPAIVPLATFTHEKQ